MPPLHTSLDAAPLAERMRPGSLEDFVGQEHLLGRDRFLRRLVETKRIPSLMLWGPPGSGKTTLARLLARTADASFESFSAVLSGVKEIRQIVAEAGKRQEEGRKTVLFVDEIHRFNKSQQDAFLPHVESGLLTLIGATTENPSFQVIPPLLSRCRVLVLNPLGDAELETILLRAAKDPDRGLGGLGVELAPDALEHLVRMADGDGRRALNSLEIAASLAEPDTGGRRLVTLALAEEAVQRRSLRYDAAGEEHYNLISALHKSLRDSDPDGALYWLDRMLVAGEDPLYGARRMIRFATEDIGNADPQALVVAMAAREAYRVLGSPEGDLALGQCALYLATAAKSNALYKADAAVRKDIERTGSLPVPLHLRNAPTRLMASLGYGAGYRYAHDFRDGVVDQEHLPEKLAGRSWYQPTNRGYEAVIKDRLTKWQAIKKRKVT